MSEILDLSDPEVIEIKISNDGKTVWINDEVTCVFRASRIGTLILTDERKR